MRSTALMKQGHERWFLAIQVTALAALLAAVVLVQTPNGPVFVNVLQKLGHSVVFGLCSVVILSMRRRSSSRDRRSLYFKYGSTFAITVALGVASEITEIFTHRDPSVIDVLRDALGAAVALSVCLYVDAKALQPTRGLRVRLGAALACIVCLAVAIAPMAWCVAAYANRDLRLPVLWQFSSALDLYFLDAEVCKLGAQPQAQLWKIDAGLASLCVPLPSTEASPGISLREPYPDWSGQSILMIDLSNPMSQSLQLTVRVHDRHHNQEHQDRFNRSYVIAARMRYVIAIPLEEIAAAPRGRRMDMQHIAHIGIFRSGGTGNGFLLLHRIWLQ